MSQQRPAPRHEPSRACLDGPERDRGILNDQSLDRLRGLWDLGYLLAMDGVLSPALDRRLIGTSTDFVFLERAWLAVHRVRWRRPTGCRCRLRPRLRADRRSGIDSKATATRLRAWRPVRGWTAPGPSARRRPGTRATLRRGDPGRMVPAARGPCLPGARRHAQGADGDDPAVHHGRRRARRSKLRPVPRRDRTDTAGGTRPGANSPDRRRAQMWRPFLRSSKRTGSSSFPPRVRRRRPGLTRWRSPRPTA